MNKLLQAVSACLLTGSAFAQEPDRPNTSTTTWEIYGFVVIVLAIGFVWVYFKQKRDKEREARRRAARSA